MSSLSEKVEKSIDRLKKYAPPEGYYLAFSGGKDSVVCKALLDMAGRSRAGHLLGEAQGQGQGGHAERNGPQLRVLRRSEQGHRLRLRFPLEYLPQSRAVSEEKTMRMLPILFNTPMVQAILGGRKTQTRRVIKYIPDVGFGEQPIPSDAEYMGMHIGFHIFRIDSEDVYVDSPYHIGDILYVRETWGFGCTYSDEGEIYYRATDEMAPVYKWHPSIHMPKEVARIFLRVTDMRVERLQDITGEDCVAEGCDADMLSGVGTEFIRGVFSGIWDSTIKPADRARYGWDANPWVWVYTFERCEKPEGWA